MLFIKLSNKYEYFPFPLLIYRLISRKNQNTEDKGS